MLAILHDFLLIFIPLFVVIDPAGSIPIYLALTRHHSDEKRRRIAVRATVVAAITGLLFIILGQAVLRFLGLRFEDLQIAGGLLLVVLAIVDLLRHGKPAVDENARADDDLGAVGIVPLAVPLIVGPATMTTSLLLVNTYSKKYIDELHFGSPLGQVLVTAMVAVALLINLGILLLGMWYSKKITALVGRNTMEVINKIVMILIAAIAVSLIRQGIQGIMTSPGH
jgi:multiple antibiotic resistance protein